MIKVRNYFNDFRPLIISNKIEHFYKLLQYEKEGKEVNVIPKNAWKCCPWFRKKDDFALKAPKIDFDDCDIAKYMYRIIELFQNDFEN